jgi:hypothetical protein
VIQKNNILEQLKEIQKFGQLNQIIDFQVILDFSSKKLVVIDPKKIVDIDAVPNKNIISYYFSPYGVVIPKENIVKSTNIWSGY